MDIIQMIDLILSFQSRNKSLLFIIDSRTEVDYFELHLN